jgi:hypothetical protein
MAAVLFAYQRAPPPAGDWQFRQYGELPGRRGACSAVPPCPT